MARPDRREDALHRTGQPVGERLQRELQQVAARRTAQRRNLLYPCRGEDPDRGMATPLQHRPPTQQPRIPTTGTGGRSIASAALRLRFAPPTASTGDGGNDALTIKLGHSVGAGHLAALTSEAMYRSIPYCSAARSVSCSPSVSSS